MPLSIEQKNKKPIEHEIWVISIKVFLSLFWVWKFNPSNIIDILANKRDNDSE